MRGNEERKKWDLRFGVKDYLFGTAPNAFLFSQRDLLKPGQRALAVADGEGRNGVWLARQGLEVLSTDFSQVALAKARALAAESGATVQTECCDLTRWDWGAPRFDVVVAIFIQLRRRRNGTSSFSVSRMSSSLMVYCCYKAIVRSSLAT